MKHLRATLRIIRKAFSPDKGGQAGLLFTINIIRRLIFETKSHLLYIFRELLNVELNAWPLAYATTM